MRNNLREEREGELVIWMIRESSLVSRLRGRVGEMASGITEPRLDEASQAIVRALHLLRVRRETMGWF